MSLNEQHYEKWNTGAKHKWFTKAIARKLPRLGETDGKDAKDVRVAVKLFNPTGIGTWYITEANLDEGVAFGYADLGYPELGYIDLKELRAFRGRFGLTIERDEHFKATLAEVMSKLR